MGAAMSCITCGFETTAQSGFCPGCGTSLVPPRRAAAGPQPSPIGDLGRATVLLLGVTAVAEAVEVLAHLVEGAPASLSAVVGVSLLLTTLAFLAWFRIARRNAGLWGPQRYSQGWAIAGWVIPVVNFWLPVQIMRDIWQAGPLDTAERRDLDYLTKAWWTCWLLAWATGFRYTTVVSEDPDGTTSTQRILGEHFGDTTLSAAFATAAAVLLLLIVSKVTRQQEARTG
jgi:hypothetical protein